MKGKQTHIPCESCGRQADRLGYYSKVYYYENLERPTIEDPCLACVSCWAKKKFSCQQIVRGGDEKAEFIYLSQITRMTPPQISKLCSMKGREINRLHGSDWRKKVWWINKAARPVSEDI